jgi:hypothetical protein
MTQHTNLPASPAGFISDGELLQRVPVCRETLGFQIFSRSIKHVNRVPFLGFLRGFYE